MGTIWGRSYDDYCQWVAERHAVDNWHKVKWTEADRERIVERVLGYCGWDCASCRDADRACIRHQVYLFSANGQHATADLLLCKHDPTAGLPDNNPFYQLGGHRVCAIIEVKGGLRNEATLLRQARGQAVQYYLHLSRGPYLSRGTWGSNGALWVVTSGFYWEWGDAPDPPDGEPAVHDSGTIGDAAFRQWLHRRFTVDNLLADGPRG